MQLKELVNKILTKKAKGYTTKEKTEDYAVSNGEAVLVKRKIVTKHVPPDINAVKALLQLADLNDGDINKMTDAQLEVERLRLIGLLQVCDQVSTEENKQSEKEIDND